MITVFIKEIQVITLSLHPGDIANRATPLDSLLKINSFFYNAVYTSFHNKFKTVNILLNGKKKNRHVRNIITIR